MRSYCESFGYSYIVQPGSFVVVLKAARMGADKKTLNSFSRLRILQAL